MTLENDWSPGKVGWVAIGHVGRTDLRRRENLSPLEVEQVLAEHCAVADCAVVGVPSELSKDEVNAFMVRPTGQRRLQAARRVRDARLTAFKVPRYWQLIEELPRTPTARVAKHRLPAEHQPAEYDAQTDQEPSGQPPSWSRPGRAQ